MSGSMDARSSPDEVELNGWRYILNTRIDTKNKICRATGFDKHLTRDNYNNQDLHDQLLSKVGSSARQPINFLFEAISTRKTTKLLAGTKNAIYALNNATGNWKSIWDNFNSENRMRGAQLGDTVYLTNNSDNIKYWQFDQGITEDDNQSVADIPDLATIGITKVALVAIWKDVVFLMGCVVDGTLISNSIFWGDYQKPLSFIPQDGSLAGRRDLDLNETILGALPLSNRLLIYTNRSIWEAAVSSTGFVINKRYDPKDGDACLFYPNTLVSTGDKHVFCGRDGIYTYSLFEEKPLKVDWLHKASSVMYDFFDADNCNIHVAGYNTDKKEVMISYAKLGESLPSETLVFNTDYPFAYVLDHGFSAFVTYTLKEPVQILQDFLLDHGICIQSQIDDYFGDGSKEGGVAACSKGLLVDEDGKVVYGDGGGIIVD